MVRSYANNFLLHIPTNDGTYFDGSLTYVCTHSEEGALGLIVNRPLKADVNLLFEAHELEPQLEKPPKVFEGGPVDSGVPGVLHTDDVVVASSLVLSQELGLVLTLPTDINAFIELLRGIADKQGPSKYLITLGYAGWRDGQLDKEINNNFWLTCPSSLEVIFDAPVDQRARLAAASIGIDLDMLAGQSSGLA